MCQKRWRTTWTLYFFHWYALLLIRIFGGLFFYACAYVDVSNKLNRKINLQTIPYLWLLLQILMPRRSRMVFSFLSFFIKTKNVQDLLRFLQKDEQKRHFCNKQKFMRKHPRSIPHDDQIDFTEVMELMCRAYKFIIAFIMFMLVWIIIKCIKSIILFLKGFMNPWKSQCMKRIRLV